MRHEDLDQGLGRFRNSGGTAIFDRLSNAGVIVSEAVDFSATAY